jgi:multiple sugar transport system substrate-binding protein
MEEHGAGPRSSPIPEAPQNTEELIEAALEAEKKNPNVDGYLFNGGRWEGTTFDNLDHFWSLGGELVDENGKPVFGQSPNREKMLKVLEFLKESVDSGAAPKRVATIADYNEFLAAAEQGTVAMFHGGDFQYAQIKESLPPEEFEKWEVSPVPPMPGGGEATGAGGWTMAALSEDPKKVATCMDFTRSVYMGPANDVTGLIPTTPKQFDTLDTFDEPIYDEFREMLKFGQARPGFAIYPEISTQLQIAIGNTLTGESTPEQALDDAVNTVNRAYEQQQK